MSSGCSFIVLVESSQSVQAPMCEVFERQSKARVCAIGGTAVQADEHLSIQNRSLVRSFGVFSQPRSDHRGSLSEALAIHRWPPGGFEPPTGPAQGPGARRHLSIPG